MAVTPSSFSAAAYSAAAQLRDFIRDLVSEAAAVGDVRSDVAADELATYCLHALAGAAGLASNDAVARLVAVTFAGLSTPADRHAQTPTPRRTARIVR